MTITYDDESPAEAPRPKIVYEERRAAPESSKPKVGMHDVLYPLDVAGALGSGMVAGPLSGLAGIAGTLLPGKEGQGAKWTKSVGEALTYQPKTAVGGLATEIISKPFEWLHKGAVKAAETAQDKLGLEPAGATAVQTAIEALPALGLMARAQPAKSPKVAAAESLNEVRDATYTSARQEGYKFPVSATVDSFTNRRIEGGGGRTLLNQEMVIHNQKITNKIAAKEIGLPENTAITPGRLEARRTELSAPYREAASIDALVAKDILELRQARADANKYYRFYEAHPNPMVERKAQRLMAKAEELEGYIETAAKNAGKPDLLDRLRSARKEIAKTYDVERSLIEGSGDISAAEFAKMLDKGKPLSGGLETIAKSYQAFRPYMGEASMIRNPGVDRVRSAVGIAANAMGAHGGIGWLSEGIPLAAGPMRSLAMSDFYQNSVGKPSYQAQPPTGSSLAALLSQVQQAQQERREK